MSAAVELGQVVTTAEVLADLAAGTRVGTRVYQVPPGELVIGANTRVDVRLDPEFASSVAQLGVLQPVICHVDDDRLVVLMGQRRVLAAAAAGRARVAVVLVEPSDDVARVIDQLAENEARAPITTADRAAAMQQLALLGLPAGDIVARTALRRADVEHALAVAASPTAAAVAAEHPVDLEQAAAVAEFEDQPDVVEALVDAVHSGGFAHVVERAREDRHDRDEHTRIMGELTAAGVAALPDRPDYRGPARHLDELRIPVDAHAGCGGHAAYPVHGDVVVDGHVERRWHPRFVCTDAARFRHLGPEQKRDPSLIDEQARRDRALAAQRTRDWRISERVRRTWLRDFTRGRGPLPGAEQFIAATVVAHGAVLAEAALDGHRLLRALLYRDLDAATSGDDVAPEVRRSERARLQEQLTTGQSRRAVRLTCALLLAAWDARTDERTWRTPRPEHAWFLGQMHTWGYDLSPVEQLATGQLELVDDDGTTS